TGTHQNFRDAWFVGGVPQYTTAVWVGFPDAQIPLQNLVIHGEYYSRVFGGSVPAPIWRQFMEIALAGIPVVDFPPPAEGVEALFRVPETEVPSVVGLFVSEAKDEILKAHLKPAVHTVNSFAPKGTVLGQSPGPGAVVQQGSGVSLSVSSGLPPAAPVPNLLGIPEAQVDPAVQAFADSTGLTVSYSLAYSPTSDPNLVGKVTAVSPAPGTMIENGAHLTITIGTQPPPPEEEEEPPPPPDD
ncbi:MAG: PASTA domain-containing protein, partial [Acidimicrobiia bacterium]